MLEEQITYSMPVLSGDLSVALQKTEELMLASVQLNIMMGGRPKAFKTKNPNSTPLVGTGRMYAGLRSGHDGESATVYMDSSVVSKSGFPYPVALNNGANIPEVDGKLMVFEIDGHTVFTYHRKGFKLGAFPFMIFQEQDKVRILEIFADSVFTKQQITFSQ